MSAAIDAPRMSVTHHAMRRTRKGLGIPKKSVEKNTQRAAMNGIHHLDTQGKLRRYLDKIRADDNPDDRIVVYHCNVYIFDGNTLVTMFPLPKYYQAAADKLKRNGKKVMGGKQA